MEDSIIFPNELYVGLEIVDSHYENGKREGLFTYWYITNVNGDRIMTKTEYYKNGLLISRNIYNTIVKENFES